MRMKYSAFTVAELVIVTILIIIIAIAAFKSAQKLDEAKTKKLFPQSLTFFSTIKTVYKQIVLKYTQSEDITTLKDANGDGVVNSEDLRKYFTDYINSQNADCKNIKLLNNSLKKRYLNENARCFYTPDGLFASVEYDGTCSLDAQVKEFLHPDDKSVKIVNNACVRIIYSPSYSSGRFAKDVFVVAFDKEDI